MGQSLRDGARLVGALCLALLLHGCAAFAARAARSSTAPVISESLRTMNEPESRRLIGQIMTMPEIQEGTRQLAASLTSGVLSELTAEERQQRLQQATQQFVESATSALVRAFGGELGPALGKALSQALNEFLAAGLTADNRAHLEQATTELTRALGRGLAESLRTDIGPALHDVIIRDIGPALQEVVQRDFRGSMQNSAEEIAFGAVLGVDQATKHLQAQSPVKEPSLSEHMGDLMKRGLVLTNVIIYVTGLILVGLLVWLLWYRPHHRKMHPHPIHGTIAGVPVDLPPEVILALREIFKNPDSARAFADELRKHEESKPLH